MSYAAFASLASGKRRVWLYEITVDGTVTRLTNRTGGYTFNSNAYANAKMNHSKIVQTAAIARASVTITFPRTNTLAQSIRDSLNHIETNVKVLEGDENDPDQEFVTRFDGRIVGVKPLLGTISLICESNFTKFRRKSIPAIIQSPCRHALYSGSCGVSLAAFSTAATATAWASPVLTVTEASGQADGYYSGGLVIWGSKQMMITKHVGSSLTLLGTMSGLAAEITGLGSAAVQIAPGCNRSMSQCISRFSNVENFGGFPWMGENPFDGRSLL